MGMLSWAEYLKFLVSLLSIVNSIGAIPIFINLTTHQSAKERNRTGFYASLSALVVLMVVLLTGESLLNFFGITIASFRVGGGILILLMSVSMMYGRISPVRQTEEEARDVAEKNSVAVVPLGIPLLAGPGAISTVIVYANYESSWSHLLYLSAAIFIVSVAIWATFRLAPLIASALGKTGINIVTRIMGLIIAAVAIEFIASGLKQLLPGLS